MTKETKKYKITDWLSDNKWHIILIGVVVIDLVMAVLKMVYNWNIAWWIILLPLEVIGTCGVLFVALFLLCFLGDIDGEMWRRDSINKKILEHQKEKETL